MIFLGIMAIHSCLLHKHPQLNRSRGNLHLTMVGSFFRRWLLSKIFFWLTNSYLITWSLFLYKLSLKKNLVKKSFPKLYPNCANFVSDIKWIFAVQHMHLHQFLVIQDFKRFLIIRGSFMTSHVVNKGIKFNVCNWICIQYL